MGSNSVSDATTNIDNQKGCANKDAVFTHPKGKQKSRGSQFLQNLDVQQQHSTDETPKTGLLFVEVFAGSAKLSHSARERGFRTMAIDHGGNQHEPHHEISVYDLTSPVAQSQLLETLEDDVPGSMHMAPPCGTCSRARERPLKGLGNFAPKPLRDEHHPFGYPWLKGLDQTRVLQSNLLYAFVVDLLFFAFTYNIVISVENPTNSWLWVILKELVVARGNEQFRRWYQKLEAVEFSNCAWGGSRPKNTRWLSTPTVYSSMAKPCPQNHVHKPYRVTRNQGGLHFSTSEEAEYPWELTRKVVELLAKFLRYPTSLMPNTPKAMQMAASRRQHRRYQQLIPEFHSFVTAATAPEQSSKLLDRRSDDGGAGGSDMVHSRYGIFHTKQQFLELSYRVEHPFDAYGQVDDLTRDNVFFALANGPVKLSKWRLQSLIDCERLANTLEKEEKELHQTLAPHLAEVLEGKKLILFEKLLRRFDYADMEVVRFMKQGVDLVGEHVASPIFPAQLVKATTTPELLLKSAEWRNETMAATPIHSDEPEMAAKLWEVTNSEVERGFLKGPYDDLGQVREATGCKDLVVNRRFLLIQGEAGKPRAIDDCKTSGLNSAYVQNNKLTLQDLDAYVALCSYVASSVEGLNVEVKMVDGLVKTTQLSGDFQGNLSWKGKCLDLEKAYRQVPVSASSLAYSVALVHDLQGRPKYFLSQSLPFGACSSVYAFNRIGAAIRFLIQHVLKGVLTVFYDDFPLLETTACAQLMESMLSRFLTLLGWKHALAGDKSVPFQQVFTVLGAELNLTGMHLGKILVSNKPGRLERMERLVRECKNNFPPVKHQMQVLAGLLQYAVGNSLGATLRMASRICSAMVAGHIPKTRSDYEKLCDWICVQLQLVKPRDLDMTIPKTPLLVFTDAAWEAPTSGWGIVLVDPESAENLVFHGTIPSQLVEHWLRTVGQQIICQAEMYAALLSRWYISQKYSCRRAIFWIDNDASRLALIKTVSTSPELLVMAQCFHSYSEVDNVVCWFERVPSESNVADLPSRGVPQEAAKLVNGEVRDDLQLPSDVCDSLLNDEMYEAFSTLSRIVPVPKHDMLGGDAGRV